MEIESVAFVVIETQNRESTDRGMFEECERRDVEVPLDR